MDTCQQLTSHALGLSFGYFALEIGLISRLHKVSIPMKTVYHSPQEKLIEFFVSIVLGMGHLKDISHSGYPLARDTELARAWCQNQFADYTGVSRVLSRISATEYNRIKHVLFEVSTPFFEEERTLFSQSPKPMIWDCDLTGLEVSDYSQTYPHSRFGYMSHDTLSQGYQLPYLVLTGLDSKMVLSTELLAGNRNSVSCLKETIQLGEHYLGIPWRRPEFLTGTIHNVKEHTHTLKRLFANAQAKLDNESLSEHVLPEKIARWKRDLQERPFSHKPFSTYQKLKRQIVAKENMVTRIRQRRPQLEHLVNRYQERLQEISNKLLSWQAYKAQLESDNTTHQRFNTVILRHDGGFASQENLIWEAASGYYFISKGYNSLSTKSFVDRKEGDGVPLNSVSTGWLFPNESIQGLPMPVDVLLIEQTATAIPKSSVILAYLPFHLAVRELFTFYNARNTVEASIKEGKLVFGLHPFKVRSEYGIKLQQLFANFAQNFIRWFQRWAFQKTDADFFNQIGVKEIVKTAANTMAHIRYDNNDITLTFHEFSCYAGKQLLFENVTQTSQNATPEKHQTVWNKYKRWQYPYVWICQKIQALGNIPSCFGEHKMSKIRLKN
jgi:hypothetical protein